MTIEEKIEGFLKGTLPLESLLEILEETRISSVAAQQAAQRAMMSRDKWDIMEAYRAAEESAAQVHKTLMIAEIILQSIER